MKFSLLTLIFFLCSQTLCFSESLPETLGSNDNPGLHIYTPNPNMMGLNKPATPILDVRPLGQRMYGNPRVNYPGGYNHYQYLYNVYNYNRAAYPYLSYQGKGKRNPGYFNWNRNGKDGDDDDDDKPQAKYRGARIVNTPSKLTQKVEGSFTSKKFLQLWVQAAGVTKSPPAIQSGEIGAFINTPKGENPRIIKKVEPVKSGNKIARINIYYEEKDKDSLNESFYKSDTDSEKGLLSAAIFADLDVTLKFINLSEEEEGEEGTDGDENEFLDQGSLHCGVRYEVWNDHHGTNLKRNIKIESKSDVETIAEYLSIADDRKKKLLETDFDREIVYLTGRIYTSRRKALDDYTREIYKVKDIYSRTRNNPIKHHITIYEKSSSMEDFSLSRLSESEKDDLWFRGHWVRVDKPKRFGGVYNYSRTGVKE